MKTVDYTNPTSVFLHVTNNRTNSKYASAANLSKLYICGKLTINVFQSVNKKIKQMSQ